MARRFFWALLGVVGALAPAPAGGAGAARALPLAPACQTPSAESPSAPAITVGLEVWAHEAGWFRIEGSLPTYTAHSFGQMLGEVRKNLVGRQGHVVLVGSDEMDGPALLIIAERLKTAGIDASVSADTVSDRLFHGAGSITADVLVEEVGEAGEVLETKKTPAVAIAPGSRAEIVLGEELPAPALDGDEFDFLTVGTLVRLHVDRRGDKIRVSGRLTVSARLPTEAVKFKVGAPETAFVVATQAQDTYFRNTVGNGDPIVIESPGAGPGAKRVRVTLTLEARPAVPVR